MKQNLIIALFQTIAVALCTYFIIDNVGADTALLRSTTYIVAAMLVLSILAIVIFWKHFGHTLRFRITDSFMLIVSAFTPYLSYNTFIGDNTIMPAATSKLVLLYALGQLSWCLAVYIIPDLVGMFREKRFNKQ